MATSRNILREETEILYTKGRSALSDYHPIAALGGMTSEQAKAILAAENYSLAALAKYSLHDWMKVGGIGEAKATALVLALEMGRRRIKEPEQKKMKICCSSDIYQMIKAELLDEMVEHFCFILLNKTFH
ncbi:DNA repair protein RadC [Indibacter alkaliphilus LW1]|uniref:DNA repair protein RadC n=1 Tax=Indibacter alkaliphilus (strain CCUG 57479 / KCTC 22604 / LW1) TaxID=1189612 RepID=S2DYG6_INDAL|nr:DNA repair protein RadC [Indibacter alkaliphilus]EOZ97171.1 DNA repair protein RadC [Indibacter alkaliphilus LW1]